jgi:hypothetical protein
MASPRVLPLRKDLHVLAYRYDAYMAQHSLSKANGECNNPYFESLLANQDDPTESATDPRSRAIWHAKQHYECYYQNKDIAVIAQILESTGVK